MKYFTTLLIITALLITGCGGTIKRAVLHTDDLDVFYNGDEIDLRTNSLELGLAGAAGSSSLTTYTSAYRTLHSLANAASAVDTDLAAASGYNTAAVTGEVDLASIHGFSAHTYGNRVSLAVHATGAADADTLTQKIYGRADSGAPQLIASIVWTIGTARADGSTATHLWADDAAVTSSHSVTIGEADGGGSDRVCTVSFDCTGFRYIYGLFSAQTGDPTLCTCLYRVW